MVYSNPYINWVVFHPPFSNIQPGALFSLRKFLAENSGSGPLIEFAEFLVSSGIAGFEIVNRGIKNLQVFVVVFMYIFFWVKSVYPSFTQILLKVDGKGHSDRLPKKKNTQN